MPIRIIYGVLDWGLGHASRSVPVIRELIAQDCELLIASSGLAMSYLRKEFEGVEFIDLPELEITYSKSERPSNWNFILKGVLNYTKLKKHFLTCEKFLSSAIGEKQINLLISDGHFGVYSSDVKSVLISHQLNLKAALFGKQINQVNREYLRRYDQIWVPDFDNELSLAGELSKNENFENVHYLGALSSYQLSPKKESPKKRLLFLLSGPEPQRQMLQDKICEQLIQMQDELSKYHVDLVSGNSAASKPEISWLNHHPMLNSPELNELLCQADLIICRSGYSSIMDLVKLGKQAVLIPTPGQGEQEYLADFHEKKGRFRVSTQRNLHLRQILDENDDLTQETKAIDSSILHGKITSIISEL